MKECINCEWKGLADSDTKRFKCPVCGDNTIGDGKNEFDLNKDGVVDHKDVSMAAKLMGKQKKRRK